MSREFSTFMDGDDCQECDYYQKRIAKLENEIRTERALNIDAEKRIKELEAAMQEFVDRCNDNPCNYSRACSYAPDLKIQKTYNKFKQLLNK